MLFNEPHLIPLNFMPCFTIFYSSPFLTFINILSLRDSASSQLADHSCCRAVGDIVIHSPSLPQWLDLLSSSLILSAPDLHLKTSVPRHLQFFFFFFGSSALSCPRFFCLPKCHCSRLVDSSPICYFPYNFQTRKLYWCDQSLCCPLHKDLLHCSFIFILVFGWLPLPPSQLSDKFLSLPQSSIQTLPPLLLADAFPALLHQENRSHWTWTISWYLVLAALSSFPSSTPQKSNWEAIRLE